jgi:RimJ/RimL family protein N-acetyltransferase
VAVPESFRTARLAAERLTPDHLAELIQFHRDPDVMAELGGLRDEEETSRYLTRNLDHWRDHGFGVWALREPSDSRFVGRAILRRLAFEDADEIEIGYALYPEFWGRGLATEVAETCLSLGWKELDAPSLVGVTTANNLASQRVLLKVGMRYEREVVEEGTRYFLYRVQRDAS